MLRKLENEKLNKKKNRHLNFLNKITNLTNKSFKRKCGLKITSSLLNRNKLLKQ